MNIRITRLLERFKRLAIGEPKKFIPILGFLQDNDIVACRYWTQQRLQEFDVAHPEQNSVLCIGCPKVPESEWCIFGAGGEVPVTPRPCPACEHFGMKD